MYDENGLLSELDQVDTAMHASDIRTLHPYGPERVYDAFHMLQNEPAVQVISYSLLHIMDEKFDCKDIFAIFYCKMNIS